MSRQGAVLILLKDGKTDSYDTVYEDDVMIIDDKLHIDHMNGYKYDIPLEEIQHWAWWSLEEEDSWCNKHEK